MERIFEDLSETVSDEHCQAIAAMIAEAQAYRDAGGDEDVRDAALIAVARKIHHYKAGACAALCALAGRLGDPRTAKRLKKMLRDENAADRRLAQIAQTSVNVNAGNPGKARTELDVLIF